VNVYALLVAKLIVPDSICIYSCKRMSPNGLLATAIAFSSSILSKAVKSSTALIYALRSSNISIAVSNTSQIS
jgi:hypothetical protein